MIQPWDSSFKDYPNGDGNPSNYAANIQDSRSGIEERAANEHENVATGTSGAVAEDWVHKKGAPRLYYAASDAATRPDGSTSLDSGDDGRLAILSGTLRGRFYSGSAWGDLRPRGTISSLSACDMSSTGSQLASHDGEESFTSTAPFDRLSTLKLGLFFVCFTGDLSLSVDLKSATGGSVSVRILKNTNDIYTSSTTSTSYVTKTTTATSLVPGDYLGVYLEVVNVGNTAACRNFRASGSISVASYPDSTASYALGLFKALSRSDS